MTEFLQGESGQNIIAIVAIVTVCGGPFIVGAWALWLHHRRSELQAEMKREMLEMGMSADEIDRILSAGSRSRKSMMTSYGPQAAKGQAGSPHG